MAAAILTATTVMWCFRPNIQLRTVKSRKKPSTLTIGTGAERISDESLTRQDSCFVHRYILCVDELTQPEGALVGVQNGSQTAPELTFEIIVQNFLID